MRSFFNNSSVIFLLFREFVFEIPETAGISRCREIAPLIPETTGYIGSVQKLSELLV
jgi:hypothetical protein